MEIQILFSYLFCCSCDLDNGSRPAILKVGQGHWNGYEHVELIQENWCVCVGGGGGGGFRFCNIFERMSRSSKLLWKWMDHHQRRCMIKHSLKDTALNVQVTAANTVFLLAGSLNKHWSLHTLISAGFYLLFFFVHVSDKLKTKCISAFFFVFLSWGQGWVGGMVGRAGWGGGGQTSKSLGLHPVTTTTTLSVSRSLNQLTIIGLKNKWKQRRGVNEGGGYQEKKVQKPSATSHSSGGGGGSGRGEARKMSIRFLLAEDPFLLLLSLSLPPPLALSLPSPSPTHLSLLSLSLSLSLSQTLPTQATEGSFGSGWRWGRQDEWYKSSTFEAGTGDRKATTKKEEKKVLAEVGLKTLGGGLSERLSLTHFCQRPPSEPVFSHFGFQYENSRLSSITPVVNNENSRMSVLKFLNAEVHPSFVSILAAVVRRVPQHPRTLQMGDQNFHLFILSDQPIPAHHLRFQASFFLAWWRCFVKLANENICILLTFSGQRFLCLGSL